MSISSFDYDKGSIIGKREYQEDASGFGHPPDHANGLEDASTQSDNILAVLADGMGGHVGGAYASRIACSNFINHYYAKENNKTIEQRLESSLNMSNQALTDKIAEDSALTGMGTTLIGAVFEKENLHWISVGDSLLYIYRNNELKKLNKDHSYYTTLVKLVEKGEMTEEEAKQHPHRHALTSAVMGSEINEFDVNNAPYTIQSNDLIILASDGILTLSDQQIKTVIENEKDQSAKDIVKALLKAVEDIDRPRQDNTTIMVIRPRSDESNKGLKDQSEPAHQFL